MGSLTQAVGKFRTQFFIGMWVRQFLFQLEYRILNYIFDNRSYNSFEFA